jgi:hypothetical protein
MFLSYLLFFTLIHSNKYKINVVIIIAKQILREATTRQVFIIYKRNSFISKVNNWYVGALSS